MTNEKLARLWWCLATILVVPYAIYVGSAAGLVLGLLLLQRVEISKLREKLNATVSQLDRIEDDDQDREEFAREWEGMKETMLEMCRRHDVLDGVTSQIHKLVRWNPRARAAA